MSGMVYLVGAGPGDPGLITVRGIECLRRAEVVVHDRLVAPALLDYAPAGAERIYVGKASGAHQMPQAEINQLLIAQARQGKIVVRLKGGDPFVFGRGGEEALALAEAGIPFEVVPGVSSAIAVPAYAGIPVTHRGLAGGFTVITGHKENDAQSPVSSLRPLLADGHTLVFLMGVENLAAIVAALLAEGCDQATPAALIRWGTTSQQQTVVGTLGDIVERSRGLEPPAILVVGWVVALRDRLAWFERRPLLGKRVLVTRAREQASVLSRRLAELGAEPIEFPAIQILPAEDYRPLDEALARHYDWVIFTSVNGVEAVWARLQATGRDARAFAGTRLCAIGPATAAELAAHGLRADFVPPEYVTEAILAGIGDVAGQRILLPRADIARESLAAGLRQQGARVDEVVAYCTVTTGPDHPMAQPVLARLETGQIDVITFTSSSTVRGFVNTFGLSGIDSSKNNVPIVACIGPVTAQTAQELGLHVDVVADTHTIAGLIQSLVAYCRQNR